MKLKVWCRLVSVGKGRGKSQIWQKSAALGHVKTGDSPTLHNGIYLTRYKECNPLSSTMNGHGAVYPEARCKVQDCEAVIDHDRKEVWRCNAIHAELHFDLRKIKCVTRPPAANVRLGRSFRLGDHLSSRLPD